MEIKEHIPLAPMTTFEIGGAARWFVEVKNEEEIRAALAHARERGWKYAILGGGSNILVADEGFDGLVIHIASDSYSFDGDILTADAGCNLLVLIHEAARRGLGGWEKLAGIPGTIGGAARGNAGAFGIEIKDVAVSVCALNATSGEVCEFTNAECDFSYRHSFFKDHPEWIITSVQVRLAQVEKETADKSIKETIAEREKRQLQNVRTAGSFFMNPVASMEVVAQFEQEKNVRSRENRVPAGWLIEKVGMKGTREGGTIASMQHPNYLVNETGNAKAEEVRTLARRIKTAVLERFTIELKEEAVFM